MLQYRDEHTIQHPEKLSPCAVCLGKEITFRRWSNDDGSMGGDQDSYGDFTCKNCGHSVTTHTYPYDALEDKLIDMWNERFSKRA